MGKSVSSPCLFAVKSTYACFPQKPSPQFMDIVVFTPRHPGPAQFCYSVTGSELPISRSTASSLPRSPMSSRLRQMWPVYMMWRQEACVSSCDLPHRLHASSCQPSMMTASRVPLRCDTGISYLIFHNLAINLNDLHQVII
jgi:hypothetical protein